MQQILEQYSIPFAGSREPAHAMKTIFFGTVPSDGRRGSPNVGPGSGEEPLELQSGQDILVFAVPVFGEKGCFFNIEAGSNDDRTDLDIDQFILLFKMDCIVPDIWSGRIYICRF